jgi:hypothetical protein
MLCAGFATMAIWGLEARGYPEPRARPEEFGDFVKVQLRKWGKMVKHAGIQPE